MKIKIIQFIFLITGILSLRFEYVKVPGESELNQLNFKANIKIDQINTGNFRMNTSLEKTILFENPDAHNTTGIIGLGMSDDKLNFLNYLKSRNVIDFKYFYQIVNESKNEIVFGEWSKDFDNEKIQRICFVNESWACLISQISFNSNFEKNSSLLLNQIALFDLSESFIQLPKSLQKDFESKYFNKDFSDNQCNFEYWSGYFVCKSLKNLNNASVNFIFNNTSFTIPQNKLFTRNRYNEFILMIKFTGDKIVMGQSFLRNFIPFFDSESKQILMISGNQQKLNIKSDLNENIEIDEDSLDSKDLMIFIISSLIVITIVFFTIYRYLNKGKKVKYYSTRDRKRPIQSKNSDFKDSLITDY